jgi:hypothetical protein
VLQHPKVSTTRSCCCVLEYAGQRCAFVLCSSMVCLQ